MREFFGLLCCVLVCVSGPVGAQQIAGKAERTLSGVVTDGDGALVQGAHVTLQSGGTTQQRSSVTGADGHFRFEDVATGEYRVTVSADGWRQRQRRGR